MPRLITKEDSKTSCKCKAGILDDTCNWHRDHLLYLFFRTCNICDELKPLTDFWPSRGSLSKQRSCMKCQKESRRIALEKKPLSQADKEKIKRQFNNFQSKQIETLADSYIVGILRQRRPPKKITPRAIKKARKQIIQDRENKKLANFGEKFCHFCEKIKNLEDFRVSQSGISGRRPDCRVCGRNNVKASQKKIRENLTDGYVCHILTQHSTLKSRDLPPLLIELKRSEIIAKRLLWAKK